MSTNCDQRMDSTNFLFMGCHALLKNMELGLEVLSSKQKDSKKRKKNN
jgi:hypothetical protein